jgi:hypothetical protein
MTAPRKIYVIEQGEYSDYSVICAFESEEDATRVCAGYDVKEMVLYPPGVDPVETHLGWTLTARVHPDGSTDEYMPPKHSVHHDWENTAAPMPWQERPHVDVKDLRHNSWACWLLTATGRDLETVKKAMSDRVAHLRAEAMGL